MSFMTAQVLGWPMFAAFLTGCGGVTASDDSSTASGLCVTSCLCDHSTMVTPSDCAADSVAACQGKCPDGDAHATSGGEFLSEHCDVLCGHLDAIACGAALCTVCMAPTCSPDIVGELDRGPAECLTQNTNLSCSGNSVVFGGCGANDLETVATGGCLTP